MNEKPEQERVARFITESAHQIWMLGLDALNQTEKESRRLFDTMLGLGATLQSQSAKTVDVARQTVTGGKSSAGDTLARIEQLFEIRVARALNALQIPTARDIRELATRVDELSAAVEKLNAKQSQTPQSKPAPEKKKSKLKTKAKTKKRKATATKTPVRKKRSTTTRRKKKA